MLSVKYRSQFKKDYKKAVKRGLDPEELKVVIDLLINEKPLDRKYRDHPLLDSRHYKNVRECHIQNDWLLVYCSDKEKLILTLVRTGTHSDLF
ncbi:MAG: type II toxin-antitoxin system YafQ family toxin [Burkholderiales bacterium]|nr:type II toxin-antitoxin system YafQ family toxin [Burkholderiales bacterium]